MADEDEEIIRRNRELDQVAADIEAAYAAALSDAGRGIAPRPLTKPIVSASLSNLGHNATGGVVYTTATLSSLSLNDVSVLSGFRFLQKILLDMNSLTSVAALKDCDALVHLSLSHNQLTENVFEELRGTADTLQHLDLCHNRITCLRGAEHFTFLNTLLADGNQITTVRAKGEVANLRSLWRLSLTENKIAAIERGAFRNCPLRILDLGKNELDDVTPLLDLAETLTWLGLDDNNVMHLHDVVKLTRLTTLRLAGNNVYDMAETHMLASVETLRHLALLGNPLCTFGALPAAPIDDDAESDVVRGDHDVRDTQQKTSAPARAVRSAKFAAALRAPENAPFVPKKPHEADEEQLASLSDELRYRLHVLWRVPQIATLDGTDITPAEAADAKNLVGGIDRDKREEAEKLLSVKKSTTSTSAHSSAAAGTGIKAVRSAASRA